MQNKFPYEQKMANRLAAKVAARNQTNALVNEWFPKILAVVTPWVGQKVSLVTGGIPHKLKTQIEALGLPSHWEKQIRISFDTYSAKVWAKVCVNYNAGEYSGNEHAEETAYLGDMENGLILKNLKYTFEPRKTDYTVEGVKEKRKAYEAAKKASDDARSALYPFGEHDNF